MNSQTLTIKEENGRTEIAWLSEAKTTCPKNILMADDATTAQSFLRAASEGAAFIYKGDFQNARQLLRAVQKRIDSKKTNWSSFHGAARFHEYRRQKSHRAQILSRLLIPIHQDGLIPLRRAPDWRQALHHAIQEWPFQNFLLSLKDLIGMNSSFEWSKKGIAIEFLGGRIFPNYGVFAPIRQEYLDLVIKSPLPKDRPVVFDIGTGTGVLAAILAKKGAMKVIATDLSSQAVDCANYNIKQLGLDSEIAVEKRDLFPDGKSDLIVCNPPWLPIRPTSSLETAVFDEDHVMLRSFLSQAPAHLEKDGECWLIISDMAEKLNLRAPESLRDWISKAGLEVIEKKDTQPSHKKAMDPDDPFHTERSREITSLWRLKLRN